MSTTASYTDREITANGLRLHYQEWGDADAPVILAIHGFGVSGHMFDEFAERVKDRFRVIALDQRGHGDSEWSEEGDYSRDAFVADIEAFRAALGLERFILMGHSMGGLNSVSYVAAHPAAVRTLILVDVGPEAAKEGVDNIVRFTRGPDELEFEEFVQMAHRFNTRRSIENIRERMRHRLKQMPNGKWTWKFDSRFRQQDNNALRIGSQLSNDETWALFRQVTCPTLLVRGGESDVLSQEVAERCIREMNRARLAVVPGAGHSVPGDQPDAFTGVVREFLDDVDRGVFEPDLEATVPPLTELVTAQDRAGSRPGGLTFLMVGAGAAAALFGLFFLARSSGRRRKRRGLNADADLVEDAGDTAARAMADAAAIFSSTPGGLDGKRAARTARRLGGRSKVITAAAAEGLRATPDEAPGPRRRRGTALRASGRVAKKALIPGRRRRSLMKRMLLAWR